MFENVRGPVTEHVLTYARGKIRGGFLQPTHKNLYTTPTRIPRGIGSFTPNMLPILKDEKTNLISMLLQ